MVTTNTRDSLTMIEHIRSQERQRCAGIVELMRNEWIKHTHQDTASRLVIEMLGKAAACIRESAPTD